MCEYCEKAINGPFECVEISSIPITVSGPNYEMDLAKATVELNYNSDENTVNLFQWVDFDVNGTFMEFESTQIHYCPFCGENFDKLLKEKEKTDD